MSWRSVIIGKAATLRYAQRQLCIEHNEKLTIPLEDIAVLLLEHHEILISGRLLAECAEAGVAVLTIGRDHLPNGVLLPYLAHSRALQVLQRQLNISLPAQKRAWQRIVQQKIRNQTECLRLCPGGNIDCTGDYSIPG